MPENSSVSPFFLVDFFDNVSLYKPMVAAPVISFLGENRRNICIIIQTDAPQIPDATTQILQKMMLPLQLNTHTDLAVVAHYSNNISFDAITKQLRPRKIVIFGQKISFIADLPFDTVVLLGGVAILQTYALTEITRLADEEKKRTWVKIKDVLS